MARQLSEAVDLLDAAGVHMVSGHISSMERGVVVEARLSRLREHCVEACLLVDKAREIVARIAMDAQDETTSAAERRTA